MISATFYIFPDIVLHVRNYGIKDHIRDGARCYEIDINVVGYVLRIAILILVIGYELDLNRLSRANHAQIRRADYDTDAKCLIRYVRVTHREPFIVKG